MCVFQWFLISLSVLPGSCAAILDHLRQASCGEARENRGPVVRGETTRRRLMANGAQENHEEFRTHLFPSCACRSMTRLSSSSESWPLLRSGLR